MSRQNTIDAIAEAISGLLYCTRCESGWGHGTMTQGDFIDAGSDDDVVQDVYDKLEEAGVVSEEKAKLEERVEELEKEISELRYE